MFKQAGAIQAAAYRGDIDGLRAIAVLAVVLFHARVPGFGGGFLGVDVFFVISGYLITGILLKRGTGSWPDIVRFYERRVRRIVPALATVLTACVLAALVLLSPWDFQDFSKSLSAATAFVLNQRQMFEGAYFAPDSEDQPLLHLWSLSVEEQFYLAYPLVLWILLRMGRRALAATFALGFAASMILSVWLTYKTPIYAFYFTGSRAWELLMGAAIALWPLRWTVPEMVAEALGVAGLAAVIAPITLYSDATPWPGLAAAVPCAGTALLLTLHAAHDTLSGRLLRLRPVRGAGLISYSLYLWHWPLFVFFGYALLRNPLPLETAALVLASIAIAWASWRFVERPFRRPGGVFTRPALFRMAAATAALFIAFALTGRFTGGLPGRVPPEIRRADAVMAWQQTPAAKRPFMGNDCFANDLHKPDYNYDKCFVVAPDRPNIVLWGDSNAMHFVVGLDRHARQAHIHLIQATHATCIPALPHPNATPNCRAFNGKILDRMDRRISTAILSGRLYERLFQLPAMQGLVRKLVSRGIHVIVLGPSPTYVRPEPQYVERYITTGDPHFLDSRSRLRPDFDAVDAAMASAFAHEPGVTYISVRDTVCADGRCPMMVDGLPTERDRGHLTYEGSQLFGDLLWPKIAAALPQPVPGGDPVRR